MKKASEIFEGENSSLRKTFDNITMEEFRNKHTYHTNQSIEPTHHDWEEDFVLRAIVNDDFRTWIEDKSTNWHVDWSKVKLYIEKLLDQERIDENKRVIEMLKRYKPNIAQEIDNALVMEQQYKFYPH